MSASGKPRVFVGVPVWRGADFVAETLRSVLCQRGCELSIFISVDGADEPSAAACRPFLGDSRVRLVLQPARLGWVGNARAIFAAAVAEGADYACLQAQDDLLDETYLASLLAVAAAHPGAAIVFSDIRAFGLMDRIFHQPSVTGSPFDRQHVLLRDHFNAVAFRGLTRLSALRAVQPISGNQFDDYAADTVWMARLALAGELICLARPLYRKRYHAGNTHGRWDEWPRQRKISAWTQHCIDMFAGALTAADGPASTWILTDAAWGRLLRPSDMAKPWRGEIATLSAAERAQTVTTFALARARLRRAAAPGESPPASGPALEFRPTAG